MKMKYFYSLILSFFTVFNFSAQSFSDDFETYTPGDYLAVVSSDWTTWSGNSGGADDVQITDVDARSGVNSIYFTSSSGNGGPQDVVLPFGGQYTTGNFEFECAMKVETGKNAYFNFQGDVNIGTSWTLHANFDNGSVTVDDGGANSVTGTYPVNSWFQFKMDIDLTANSWELILDGVSAGSFANGDNKLASIDIYPLNGSGFYVDDVSYSYTTGSGGGGGGGGGSSTSLNMQELGYLDLVSMHNSDLSDIWGWATGSNEYAIVGVNAGTSVVDITDPTNPTEIFYEPGMNSIWRDIKTYNGYAYVTTEAQNGLLIIDLNSLPGNTNLATYYYTGPSGNEWESAHNLYIDENGICYIFGANRGNGGCIMLDLNTSPTNPTEIGEIDNWYVHDGVAMGDTLYLAHILDGFFTIWDISNVSNMQMLGQQISPGAFCHNLWFSDDGDYVYTTDEISNGYIGEYNISDPTNMVELDRIQSSPGMDVIPHNAHFINDYIVTSYYRDGVVIHDVSNKGNMIEVGNFDTSPNFTGDGFNGCWGVFPWLPSGHVIASDIEKGLYVLGVNYERGCYLEGNITDVSTTAPINNANIEILGVNIYDQSSLVGDYATGHANSGTYDVVYSHPQYISDTAFGVSLSNGVVTIQDMQLIPLQGFNLVVHANDFSASAGIANAEVVIYNNDFTFNGQTDANGDVTFSSFYPGTYNIHVGLWGYVEYCSTGELIDGSNLNYIADLDQGYADFFNLDLGWTVSGNAPDGVWERAIPDGTTYQGNQCNPGEDALDCGDIAYVTGNAGGNAGSDDVDQSSTILESPFISLSSSSGAAMVELSLWWYNDGGNSSPNDTLSIYVNDGNQEELIGQYFSAQSGMQWVSSQFLVSGNVNWNNFKVKVVTADWQAAGGHLVEAGIDNFRAFNVLSVNSMSKLGEVSIYPNPSNGEFYINTELELNAYEVYDLAGKLVQYSNISSNTININDKGVYLVIFKGDGIQTAPKKIIVY
jgi:choice-of-anchor B domain-containing protein